MPRETFDFRGSGISCCWLWLWTFIASLITFGLFFPWAYSAQQRWIASNTYVNGRQLIFKGTGVSFFVTWLIILVLTTITFGLFTPWGYCMLKRWETNNTYFADEQDD